MAITFLLALFSAPLRSMDQGSPFGNLSNDTGILIFQWLDFPDLITTSLVCKGWMQTAYNEELWKRLFMGEYCVAYSSFSLDDQKVRLWRACFLDRQRQKAFAEDVLKIDSWPKEKIEKRLSEFEKAEQDLICNLEHRLIEYSSVFTLREPGQVASFFCTYRQCFMFACKEVFCFDSTQRPVDRATLTPNLHNAITALASFQFGPDYQRKLGSHFIPPDIARKLVAITDKDIKTIENALVTLNRDEASEIPSDQFLKNIYMFALIASNDFLNQQFNLEYIEMDKWITHKAPFPFSFEEVIDYIAKATWEKSESAENPYLKSLKVIMMGIIPKNP